MGTGATAARPDGLQVSAPRSTVTGERTLRVVLAVHAGERRAQIAAEVPLDQPAPAAVEAIWDVALLDAAGTPHPEASGLTQRGAILRAMLAFRRVRLLPRPVAGTGG